MAEYIDRAKAFCLLRDELPDILGTKMQDSDIEYTATKVLTCLRSVPVEFETPFVIKDIPEQEFIDMVKKAPIQVIKDDEDVEPVKHGKWIQVQDCEYMRCSYCKEEYFDEYGSFENGIVKYCPHCGAKMDGEKEVVENDL